jgi:HSP20 family protein
MSLLVRRNGNGLTRPFRSIVSDLFDNDSFLEGEFLNRASVPAVNVKETDDNFEIEVAAPGMKKKDFKVDVENGILNISAETEENTEEKEENYTRKEFSYSSFSRSFTLPESLSDKDISAKYNEGVLSVVLTKKEEAKIQQTKTIAIQ